MKHAHRIGLVTAMCAALALPAAAPGAAGGKLPVPVASHRAAAFAKRTCEHDRSCARHGVSNCRRKRARVVLCRIFVRRHTEFQGRYRCTRLVRLAATHGGRHARVTGLGVWTC